MRIEDDRYVCDTCAWMIPDSYTFDLFESIMLEDSIFRSLDEKMTTFTGIHYLFRDFETGSADLFGCFSEDKQDRFLIGFVFGTYMRKNKQFIGHLMLRRKTDALSCVSVIQDLIKSIHPKCKKLCAEIPVFNKAAMRVAKKFGCVEIGDGDGGFLHNGRFEKTRIFVKEI